MRRLNKIAAFFGRSARGSPRSWPRLVPPQCAQVRSCWPPAGWAGGNRSFGPL